MSFKTSSIPVELHSISPINFDDEDESIVLSRSNTKPGVLILTVSTRVTTRWFALEESELRLLYQMEPFDDEELDD